MKTLSTDNEVVAVLVLHQSDQQRSTRAIHAGERLFVGSIGLTVEGR